MTWLRRHPAAAAALVYAALSVSPVRAGAAARAHAVGLRLPLVGRALGVGASGDVPFFGSNYELVDSAAQSSRGSSTPASGCRDVPLWNP